MKRWFVLAVPLLLFASVALAQLITGGGTSSGGGGAAGTPTVQVTIGLTGNGSAASPLAIITPVAVANGGTGSAGTQQSITFSNNCNGGASVVRPGNNQILLTDVNLPNTIVTSRIGINKTAANNADIEDWGLYNSSGTLVADVGATVVPTATWVIRPFAQGTVTLPAGQYFFGATIVGTTNTITGCSGSLWPFTEYVNTVFASPTTTAGALATTITVPTPNPAPQGVKPVFTLLQ